MSEEKEVYRPYPQPPLPSQAPRLESRVRAQEQLNTMLHASLVELKADMEASFKQQVDYQLGFEQRVLAEIAAVRTELKTEMSAMETRILDAFQQLVSLISARPGPAETSGDD